MYVTSLAQLFWLCGKFHFFFDKFIWFGLLSHYNLSNGSNLLNKVTKSKRPLVYWTEQGGEILSLLPAYLMQYWSALQLNPMANIHSLNNLNTVVFVSGYMQLWYMTIGPYFSQSFHLLIAPHLLARHFSHSYKCQLNAISKCVLFVLPPPTHDALSFAFTPQLKSTRVQFNAPVSGLIRGCLFGLTQVLNIAIEFNLAGVKSLRVIVIPNAVIKHGPVSIFCPFCFFFPSVFMAHLYLTLH